MKRITTNIFYEMPDGKIIKMDGLINAIEKTFSCYFDGYKLYTASYDEVKTWKPRFDLKDFPNAIDPLLPFIFDLYYDLKHISELKAYMKKYTKKDHMLEGFINYYQLTLEE